MPNLLLLLVLVLLLGMLLWLGITCTTRGTRASASPSAFRCKYPSGVEPRPPDCN